MARISLDQAAKVMPSIDGLIIEMMAKVNMVVEKHILRGFEADVREKRYHFSFNDQDQSNFTQELIRANLAQASGQAEAYRAYWRGHNLDRSGTVTLELTLPEFVGLAMTGGEWKAAILKQGWRIKNELEQCRSVERLQAIDERFKITEMFLAARDGLPFEFHIDDDILNPPSDPNNPTIPEIPTPKISYAQNHVLATPGEEIPLPLQLGEIPEAHSKTQFHLHIWARNCEVHNFGDHMTYGRMNSEDHTVGDGFGMDATRAELVEAISKIRIAAQEEYGLLDISIYPVNGNGLSTENFYIQDKSLPKRDDLVKEIDIYNRSVPEVPQDVQAERDKAWKDWQDECDRINQEHGIPTDKEEADSVKPNEDGTITDEQMQALNKRNGRLMAYSTGSHTTEGGEEIKYPEPPDLRPNGPDGLPLYPWDMRLEGDVVHFYKKDVEQFHKYRDALPKKVQEQIEKGALQPR